MNRCHPLAADNVAYLRQGVELLDRIDDAIYAHGNPATFGSGFGPHLRHCIDHYACFLAGLAAGRVDYDARDRDLRVETDRSFARDRLETVIAALEAIPPERGDERLMVRMDCGGDNGAASAWSGSTVGRELQFLVSHTVHHYALIAFILRSQGVDTGPAFGVAPSTLRHQQARPPCAR